jgi:uncharacterized protein (DUF2336 family)
MSDVASLIRDLENSIHRGSSEARLGTLRQVTDLFLLGADHFGDQHIEVFDMVMSRLAVASEARLARAELAERLAGVANAPPGLVRSLAHDEILVARPLLERSARLDDRDLVSVATSKGDQHMLAIAARVVLSETLTDVLLSHGDAFVARTVAANAGARLSPGGLDRLVERSRADETLQILLVQRADMAERHVSVLLATARETARQGLARTAADRAVAAEASDGGAPGRSNSPNGFAAPAKAGPLPSAISEADLVRLAGQGALDEAVRTLAAMTRVPMAVMARVFAEAATDLLLILAKSQNFAWPTVAALIELRGAPAPGTRAFKGAVATYEHLSVDSARRVLRFLCLPDPRPGSVETTRRQRHRRRNVR